MITEGPDRSTGFFASLAERARDVTSTVPAGRQIARAAYAVVRGFLLVAVASALRELLIAREFGVSDTVDAYVIALVFPSFCLAVCAGSFNSAVVPTFLRVLHREGSAPAEALLSTCLLFGVLLLIVATIILAALFPSIVPHLGSSFSPAKLDLTRRIFFLLAPVITFGGLSLMYASAINAMEGFTLPAMIPAATPLLVSALLLVFHARVSIETVAVTVSAASVLEASLLATTLRGRGMSPVPRWLGISPEARHILRQYLAVVASTLLMSFLIIIDQSMAATLGAGAPSALGYATKIVSFGTGIASVALGVAVMPYFSRMVVAEQWQHLRRSLRAVLAVVLAVTVPVSVVLAVLSPAIVRLLFQRGAFGPHDTQIVAGIQRMLSFQIPFFVASIPIVRAISALRANHVLAMTSVLSISLKVMLNYVFMQRLGIAGIALSTSCVYFVSFAFLTVMLRREIARHAAAAHDDGGHADQELHARDR